tara:strand:- start:1586 stop:2350 length:765 start_codon:yes stop_codon:yes gene_type:complete
MEKMKLKKGQVSIFIILGILIVVVLLLLFSRDAGFDTIFAKQSPYQEIEGCAQTAIQEGLDILMLQGGVIESENYFMYEGKKIDYVCYSENEYENCIMQKPILTNTIRDELEEYSTPKIKSCLNSVKSSLEGRGYSVVMRDPEIVIELVPDNVLVDMNLGLRIEKTGVESFDHIRTGIKSKIYNFALITSSISQWETRYGDSETLNYMLYYPSLKVEKKKQGDGTTVYILTDRDTDEKFYFASRSIAIPAGFIV